MLYGDIFYIFKKGFKRGLVILVALMLLAPGLHSPDKVVAAGNTVVYISSPISVGDHLTANVIVEPGNAVAGVQFSLNFNPALITVDNVEEGDLLSQDGASTFFIPGDIDNDAGTITGIAGVIISPGRVVSTGGTFAIINFMKLTDDEDCPLNLSNVMVGDIEGNSLPVSVVNDPSHSPILNPIGDKTIDEGESLTFVITATDPDGDALSYSALNLPPGASFDLSTHMFSWTPGYDQSGAYADVYFEVSDGSLTDFEEITITVSNAEPSNDGCDLNGDGVVNVSDLIRITRHFGKTKRDSQVQEQMPEDVNADGIVNVLDIIHTIQNWTRGQSVYNHKGH